MQGFKKKKQCLKENLSVLSDLNVILQSGLCSPQQRSLFISYCTQICNTYHMTYRGGGCGGAQWPGDLGESLPAPS